MHKAIGILFEFLEETAPDERTRQRLRDARRAALLVHGVPSDSDRTAVLNVLAQLETLSELADTLERGKVIAFPGCGKPYYIDDGGEP